MGARELKQLFDNYNFCSDTERSWTMTSGMLTEYSNEYIRVIRIDSSNNWTGLPHESSMEKMWSIIVDIKKDFTNLPTYSMLKEVGFNIKVTKVNKGKNKGKHGIRIYGMVREPNQKMIYEFMNYLFN